VFGSFTPEEYLGFWILILAQLISFAILHRVSNVTDIGWFSIPLVVATLVHFCLIVFRFVIWFNEIKIVVLLENLFFAVVMAAVSGYLIYQSQSLIGSNFIRRTRLRDVKRAVEVDGNEA
jgi:hypothetical protein